MFAKLDIRLRHACLGALASALVLSATMSRAEEATTFVPQVKLQVTVMQWQPVKGSFEVWPALTGEYVVSTLGELTLPVVGRVSVTGEQPDTLAKKIAGLIQRKTGLLNPPETTVAIVEYPPIYVVGEVSTPGEYKYRQGMTAIQALALGGGVLRDTRFGANDETQIAGTLREVRVERLRSTARIARLKAEEADAASITFPPAPADPDDAALADQVNRQEQVIFEARRNELDRQSRSLTELRELLNAEINTLNEKIKASENSIVSAQKELAGVEQLVRKGIAIASRQTDLERTVSGYQNDRLDRVTELMRARQGVSEATRGLSGLVDRRRTDVSSELQLEEGRLNILKVKEDVAREIMSRSIVSLNTRQKVAYSIRRVVAGESITIPAGETSPVLPGDVVMVRPGSASGDTSEQPVASIQ